MKIFLFLILIPLFISCKQENSKIVHPKIIPQTKVTKEVTGRKKDTLKYTNGFDFPVGKPNASKYYNAQKFGKNSHLGEDWNGIGGGNSDLKDPIYAIANGYVVFAENFGGGWGNIIRIIHYRKNKKAVESFYAHCNDILVKNGTYVSKGEQIGTIGNNDGQYYAHLHLELREDINLPVGPGYSEDTTGYLDPTEFIKKNRK